MSAVASPAVRSATRRRAFVHPLPVRIMHWINVVAIFIMIGSGWKIYNDDVIFSFLRFPDSIAIGKWAQYGPQRHFFGMWIFVLNGIAYLSYGIVNGRFRRKLLPISIREVLVTVDEALRFRLRHDDLTHYNAVQKVFYLGVMCVGVLIVISGLSLWKPVQFSELANLFGSFQNIRRDHRRSVRLSLAAAHFDQARLQEREMDQSDRSVERFPRHLLERTRLQLVRRNLVDRGCHIGPRPHHDWRLRTCAS